MVALATPGGSELPPKIAIHPRPAASFVHAMPALLRGADLFGDLVGMKWVAGFATNTEIGLPGISALVILNDPATGIPIAIMEDRKSTRLNSSHIQKSRMPSSA